MNRIGLILLFLLLPQSLEAWGPRAHVFVGEIADHHLTPQARLLVTSLLGGQTLADVATWADDIRSSRPDTSRWHYVDIPLSATSYDERRDCGDGRCVVAQVVRDESILADRRASRDARAEALRFLVHFIGEVHQPLHAENNGDHGGNDIELRLLGKTTNLHQVWDSRLLDRSRLRDGSELEALFQGRDLSGWSGGDVISWVNESHRLAANAYRYPRSGTLSRDYIDENIPVVEQQIEKAGLRLAATLNAIAARLSP